MELPVSEPRPTRPKFAATAAAVPPLESCRHAIQRVRVLRRAEDRAHGLEWAEGELGHVRLGQDNGAGRLDPLDEKRVFVRDESLERPRSVGALQANRLEVVLDNGGNAVERAGRTTPRESPIEIGGLLQRIRVDLDDRVQRGALLVVGLDALQVLLDERTARQLSRLHRGVDPGDRRLFDPE